MILAILHFFGPDSPLGPIGAGLLAGGAAFVLGSMLSIAVKP